MNEYPFTIKCKRDGRIISESLNNYGYVCVALNRRLHLKHKLIAKQFLPNPNNYTEIDHVSRDRTDYHLHNLRWVSRSANQRKKTSYNEVRAHYAETIPDEATVVDFYETRTETHYFENYYYHDGSFYYDNDVNYRILNINIAKSGTRYVNILDINGRKVAVYINRFLQQHDLD